MIIIAEGRMGKGKTLSINLLAYYLSKKLNKPIYANYGLKNSYFIENIDDLKSIRNGIICIDEMHNQFDSREYKDRKNIQLMREWFDYTRKFGNIVLGTTQDIGKIDKRIRQSVVCLVLPDKRKNSINIGIFEMIETSRGLFLHRNRKYRHEDVSMFYNFYDTREVIKKLE